jgi:hypothetical protein
VCGNQTCGGTPPSVSSGTCNGSGTCVSQSQPCNGFPCSGNSCATVCTAGYTSGCASGFKCIGGNSCVPIMPTCGGVTCPTGSGGQCCVSAAGTPTNAVYMCQAAGDTCDTSINSLMQCTGNGDCPFGQICCASGGDCYPPFWRLQCVPSSLANCGGASRGGFSLQACTSTPQCINNQPGGCTDFSRCLPGILTCQNNP